MAERFDDVELIDPCACVLDMSEELRQVNPTLAHWDVVEQQWVSGPERVTREEAAYHAGYSDGRRGWMCWCNDADYLEGYAAGMTGEAPKW